MVEMPETHICACRVCRPVLAPSGPRRNLGHFAIRFDDWRLHVSKDDAVVNNAYEVDVTNGTAWLFSQPPHLCSCGEGTCAYVDHGNYGVFLVQEAV